MASHDVERAEIVARLDIADARHDETIRAMETDINRLRDSWAAGYAAQLQAHETRLAQIRSETSRFIEGLYSNDEGPHEPAQGQQRDASSAGSSPASGGAADPGQPDPTYAAELAEAERIRNLSMQDFAVERQRMIRANQGMF